MTKRLNIGLLVDNLDDSFTRRTVQGAELGARYIDANLFVIQGGFLDNRDDSNKNSKYSYQYNVLYEYAKTNKLDILYVMMGSIGARVDEKQRIDFLKKYTGIPVVTLYTKTEGYPSVLFNNKSAFMEGIAHIIVEHGAKRLGYISGPQTNVDAQERLLAYKETLNRFHIEFSEDYVIYGNFEESSEELIGQFVDSHPDIDALIFANDRMAYGGYHALEKRGMRPGKDICVMGFDNVEFASGLNPSLTTVEANASELSYKAVCRANDYISHRLVDNTYVNTKLIIRESCGCGDMDVESVIRNTCLDRIFFDIDRDLVKERVCDYLFEDYVGGEEVQTIKGKVADFIDSVAECCKLEHPIECQQEVEHCFSQLLTKETLRHTTFEQSMNILAALEQVLTNGLDSNRSYEMLRVFISLMRKMAVMNWKMTYNKDSGTNRMTKFMNNMTADMFRMDSGERIPYEKVLENLSYVNIQSAYLFLYNDPVHNEVGSSFELPQTIRYAAYYDKNKSCCIDSNSQNIPYSDIFDVPHMPKNRRFTMVLSPIFSGEEIYGVFLCEAGYEGFDNITPVSSHVSSAIRSMFLLEQQDKVQTRLKESMAKLIENNNALQIMSKTDQLTGLLNRWGFLDAVQNIMETAQPQSQGAFIYADMDGLKEINDNYGHDDGDFALQSMASILRQSCDNAVVSRFGGDEFVIFAHIKAEEDIGALTQAIRMETDDFNSRSAKPYRVDMSMGICQVTCSVDIDIYAALAEADRKLYRDKRARKMMLR